MTVIEYFKNITGYNLSDFFSNYVDFINGKYNNIVSYYEGNSGIDKAAFLELDNLVKEADKIVDLLSNNTVNLSSNVEFWELLENFENAQDKLYTIKNTPKWSRSSYVNDFDRNTNVTFITKENQNLEDVSSQLGYDTPQDDWVNLAIKNDLSESDYDIEDGGALLKVTYANNSFINIQSVVDIMQGLNGLGKDIDRNITISDNDIKVLSNEDTLNQAIKMKLEIRKGSVPEFPTIGTQIVEGSSSSFLQYPILFRQLSQLFRLDDTIKSIEITDIRKDKDAVFIDITVVSKVEDLEQIQSIRI